MFRRPEESFASHLTEWIKLQKTLLETVKKLNDSIKKGDRLTLIIATRTVFQHIMRTIKAFDQWLQDPFILEHMPREMLEEVWDNISDILLKLLELDIEHTSQFRDLIIKLAKEDKLNPLVWPKKRKGLEKKPTLHTTM
ncbi:MAG: hypothetical protein B6U75_01370 [Desulfurococcales archaeon ex4484_217_1]|nr:MAG: hypothetical protein B6U75_01370 [Desulfurococcales archaeon ex4484_217_1]